MSKSIFHVRPRDTGKGWVIDEYDGRGAWQSTYGLGSETEPWDKIKAQRQVFQLRRKALNSETVNNEGAVNKVPESAIPSSEGALKRLRPGLYPAGLLPPYIESEMILHDPETGLKWKVESCSGSPRDTQGVVAHLMQPDRSMTMACNVLRTWPLGEDWLDEDQESEACPA